jgi:hypothetical protein
MMRVLLILTMTLAAPLARADPEQCRDAAESYRTAHRDLIDAIHAYGRCVAESAGHDDCATEFSAVQSARDDFEQAVQDYEDECR